MHSNNLKFEFPKNISTPLKEGYKTVAIKSIDANLTKKYESRYFAIFRARNLEFFKKRLGYIFESGDDPNYRNNLINKNRKIDEISYALFAFCDLVISSSPALRKDLDSYDNLNEDQKTDIFTRLINTKPTTPKGRVVTIDQFVNLYINKNSGLYLGVDKADIAAAVVCNDLKDFQNVRLAILKKREAAKEKTKPLLEEPVKAKKPNRMHTQPKVNKNKSSAKIEEVETSFPKSESKEESRKFALRTTLIVLGFIGLLTIKENFNLDFWVAPDKQFPTISFAETNNRINKLINQPEVRKLLDRIKSETISVAAKDRYLGSGRLLGGLDPNKLPFAIESAKHVKLQEIYSFSTDGVNYTSINALMYLYKGLGETRVIDLGEFGPDIQFLLFPGQLDRLLDELKYRLSITADPEVRTSTFYAINKGFVPTTVFENMKGELVKPEVNSSIITTLRSTSEEENQFQRYYQGKQRQFLCLTPYQQLPDRIVTMLCSVPLNVTNQFISNNPDNKPDNVSALTRGASGSPTVIFNNNNTISFGVVSTEHLIFARHDWRDYLFKLGHPQINLADQKQSKEIGVTIYSRDTLKKFIEILEDLKKQGVK